MAFRVAFLGGFGRRFYAVTILILVFTSPVWSQPTGLSPDFNGIWDGAVFPPTGMNGFPGISSTPITLVISSEGVFLLSNEEKTPLEVTINSADTSGTTIISGSRLNNRLAFYTHAEKAIRQIQDGRVIFHGFLAVRDSQPYFYFVRRATEDGIPDGQSRERWCDLHGDRLLHDRRSAQDAARQLKTRFFDELAGYDPVEAGLFLAFSDDEFQTRFGTALPDMDDQSFAEAMKGVRRCLLNSPYFAALIRDHVIEPFFDLNTVGGEWQKLHPPFSWNPLPETAAITRSAALLHRPDVAQARRQLQDMVAMAQKAPDHAGITAIFRTHPSALMQLPPQEVAVALDTLVKHLEELRLQKVAEEAAARRRRSADRMAGVNIPAEIPSAYRKMVEAITAGDAPVLTVEERSFLGGMAYRMVDPCGVPDDTLDRARLLRLYVEAFARGLGTSPDFSSMSGPKHDVRILEGADTVDRIGCKSRFLSVFAADLLEMIDAAGAPSGGRSASFIRSCGSAEAMERCKCYALVGQAVDADIVNRTYSMAYMHDLAARNPAVGFAIDFCQMR